MINDNMFCIQALLLVTSIARPGTGIIWAEFIGLVALSRKIIISSIITTTTTTRHNLLLV